MSAEASHLLNFGCHFEMLMIPLLTNHKPCTITELDIIFWNLRLVKLSRKISIIDQLSCVDKAATRISYKPNLSFQSNCFIPIGVIFPIFRQIDSWLRTRGTE